MWTPGGDWARSRRRVALYARLRVDTYHLRPKSAAGPNATRLPRAGLSRCRPGWRSRANFHEHAPDAGEVNLGRVSRLGHGGDGFWILRAASAASLAGLGFAAEVASRAGGESSCANLLVALGGAGGPSAALGDNVEEGLGVRGEGGGASSSRAGLPLRLELRGDARGRGGAEIVGRTGGRASAAEDVAAAIGQHAVGDARGVHGSARGGTVARPKLRRGPSFVRVHPTGNQRAERQSERAEVSPDLTLHPVASVRHHQREKEEQLRQRHGDDQRARADGGRRQTLLDIDERGRFRTVSNALERVHANASVLVHSYGNSQRIENVT